MPLDVIIEYNQVSICQKDHLVLKDVSFSVTKGELVYLIGRVGSGKTTLINSMIAELPIKNGDAMVAGYQLKKIKSSSVPLLRRKMGVVFQDFQLLGDRSVHDNLEFVLKATGWKSNSLIESRIMEVLQKVGLETKGYKMPHQLSGGEQQRVVIARSLLNDPEIILADEPTGNLDPETSSEIFSLLDQLSKTGRAVIIATHNYTMIKKFPARTLKCVDDTLVEVNDSVEIDLEEL